MGKKLGNLKKREDFFFFQPIKYFKGAPRVEKKGPFFFKVWFPNFGFLCRLFTRFFDFIDLWEFWEDLARGKKNPFLSNKFFYFPRKFCGGPRGGEIFPSLGKIWRFRGCYWKKKDKTGFFSIKKKLKGVS